MPRPRGLGGCAPREVDAVEPPATGDNAAYLEPRGVGASRMPCCARRGVAPELVSFAGQCSAAPHLSRGVIPLSIIWTASIGGIYDGKETDIQEGDEIQRDRKSTRLK